MEALTGWSDDYFWVSLFLLDVSVVALVMMLLFGLMRAAAKLSNNRIAHYLADAYTVVFRGTPEILVLMLIYYGSAIFLTSLFQSFDSSVKFVDSPPFWAGPFCIALPVGSYATHTSFGAFIGVHPGLIEASKALALSDFHTSIYVRVPEMWRLALPAFGNHMLSLIKDTALISIIGLNETLFAAEQAIGTTGKPFTMYIVVGCIYLSFSTIITLTVMMMEKSANRHLEQAR